jgi:hypothetical protein
LRYVCPTDTLFPLYTLLNYFFIQPLFTTFKYFWVVVMYPCATQRSYATVSRSTPHAGVAINRLASVQIHNSVTIAIPMIREVFCTVLYTCPSVS